MIKKLLPSIVLIGGIVWYSCAKKMTEEQLFAEAQKFEAQEDVENALKIYEELSDRFPKSPHADSVLQKLGMIYLNHDEQFDKAVAAYERLLKNHPQSRYRVQSLFMIGYIYANHIKDLDKAREAYNAFLKKYPQHELVTSVQWELENLGKDISDIDIFANSKDGQKTTETTTAPAEGTANPGNARSGPKVKP
jgi:tetratricopeptide (TPR) repeat protein